MQDLLGAQSDRLPEEQTFLSGAEKFFQIRAESFGPLEAKVFRQWDCGQSIEAVSKSGHWMSA